MKDKLINYYHNKQNQVILKLINDSGIHYKKIDYTPFFFIETKDLEKTRTLLKDYIYFDEYNNTSHKIDFIFTKENDRYIKVIYENYYNFYLIGITKAIINTLNSNDIANFEADLLPGDNYILDNDYEISDKYRILFYDIETRDDGGSIEIGKERIMSICAIDSDDKKYIFCDDSEKKILTDFTKILEDYDIIIGWNSNNFDIPYIKARLLINSIYFSFKSLIVLDLMAIFMDSISVKSRLGRKFLTSYALDNVCKEFINEGKLDIKKGNEGYGGRLWKLFNEDRELLIAYNMQDCRLMKLLDDEFHLIANQIEIARLVKTTLNKIQMPISLIDSLFIREARKIGIHCKSKRFNTEKVKYEGGFVLDITPGLHTNINTYDFASLYPSIMRTFNISFENIITDETIEHIATPNGIMFSKKLGLVPMVLDNLVELRLKYKKEYEDLKAQGLDEESLVKEFQQSGIKTIILSIYGVFGSIYFREFNLDVARAITLTGQSLIQEITKNIRFNNYIVVGGDTDSIFIKIDDDVARTNIENTIKNTIKDMVTRSGTNRNNYLRMEREKILDTFIIIAKKKYIGHCIKDGNKTTDYIYFKGIELVKGSEIKITKQLLETVAISILKNNADTLYCESIIKKYRNMIINKEIKDVNDILIIKKVGRLPDTYKNLPEHVALAMERQKIGELFYTGMKVPFIVVGNKPLKIIHRDDFKGVFDDSYYWINQIYPPTYRLLKVVFPKYNWDKYMSTEKALQRTLF